MTPNITNHCDQNVLHPLRPTLEHYTTRTAENGNEHGWGN